MSGQGAGGVSRVTEAELRARLQPVLDLLDTDPASLSSVRARNRWRVHVEDSLSGLHLVGAPARLADVGAGAGFPGLVLAAALPATQVDLIESVGRKAAFIERAIAAAGLANARAIATRSEEWAAGEGASAYGVVTARAVGRLSTLAELASPLLCEGGRLVAWKGRRDADEEAELERGGEALAMSLAEIHDAAEDAGFKHRHLHVVVKTGPTPTGLPRRAGIAKKRPFGAR
jgi:16S rRNA (guanine527-N7)-methyltransferase